MMSTAVDFTQDYFALFGLPQAYALDAAALDAAFRHLQASVHPDKFSHLGEVEQRRAMQASSRVNEAYQVLRSPLRRAEYLLHLRGIDPALHTNTAMPPDFLLEQMELREAVEAAREAQDTDSLDELRGAIKATMKQEYAFLNKEFAGFGGGTEASEAVRRLMFHEKLLEEIDNALELL